MAPIDPKLEQLLTARLILDAFYQRDLAEVLGRMLETAEQGAGTR